MSLAACWSTFHFETVEVYKELRRKIEKKHDRCQKIRLEIDTKSSGTLPIGYTLIGIESTHARESSFLINESSLSKEPRYVRMREALAANKRARRISAALNQARIPNQCWENFRG